MDGSASLCRTETADWLKLGGGGIDHLRRGKCGQSRFDRFSKHKSRQRCFLQWGSITGIGGQNGHHIHRNRTHSGRIVAFRQTQPQSTDEMALAVGLFEDYLDPGFAGSLDGSIKDKDGMV